jgi:ribonuclease BN (tRNA processing enzyme)
MDYIKFLGTAGARIVVSKQLRASGGIWFCINSVNIFVDPGPGALVKTLSSRPKLDPTKLAAIILSHRHLDHCADINVMIEAMTEGGFKPKGVVFCPQDTISEDPVILKYVRDYIHTIEILQEGKSYKLESIEFETPIKHIHGKVETYGINFKTKNYTISYVADTQFFAKLMKVYQGDILILNVVREKPSQIYHLCISEAIKIINYVKPKLAILTHFGMTLLRAKPWLVAEQITNETKIKTIAASDGLKIEIDKIV